MVVIAIAALLVIGGALAWRIGATSSGELNQAAKIVPVQRDPALDQLVETTKALESSQQQAVDQLQVMQDMLTAQQAEIRKSSDRVTLLGGKLDALQQSFASIPPPVADEPVVQPRQTKVRSKAALRARAHRGPAPTVNARARKQRTASSRK